MFRFVNSSLIGALAIVASSLLVNATNAASFYVRKSGSDSNTGLSKASAFGTLAKAISECSATDVIYVGAGTYDESITKRYSSGSESLQIIGDITGSYTGDSGTVIFRPGAGRWFLNIGNMQNLQLFNVEIQDPGIKTAYGIYVTNCTGSVYVGSCSFSRLSYCLYTVGTHLIYSHDSRFVDSTYGFYSTKSSYAYAIGCDIESCRYGVSVHDAELAYFYDCTSKSDSEITGGYSRAFYALRTGVYAYELTSQSDNYCLYGSELPYAYAYNCTIDQPKSAGVQLAGTDLYCLNVKVTGEGNRQGNGLVLNDTEDKPVSVQNCSVSGVYAGLQIDGSGALSQVDFSNNLMGIRFIGSEGKEIAIDGSQGVTLDGNTYGIYGYASSGQQGQLHLSNLTIKGGSYGIYTSRMSPKIQNHVITGSLNAMRCHECDSFNLSDCKIAADTEENASTGALIYAKATEIDRVSIDGYRGGLNLQNQSDVAPKLTNCSLTNCTSYGLHLRGGTANFDADSNLSFADCRMCIYGYECDLVVDGLQKPERCLYPLYCNYGSLSASNLDLSGHQTGIYSSLQSRTVLDGCQVTECLGWGVDVRSSGELSIRNVNSSDNGSGGFQIYRPVGPCKLQQCTADGNRSYGMYVYADTEIPAPELQDCTVTGSTYGLRMVGVPFNGDLVDGLTVANNNHGLRIEQKPLILDAKAMAKIRIADNQYGLMSYYGEMHLDGVSLTGNANSVYAYRSALSMKDCELTSENYGVIAYQGAKIEDCSFNDGRYGVYFAPRFDGERDLAIHDCQFSGNSSIGLYVYGDQDGATVNATNLVFDVGSHAVYGINSDTKISNSSLTSTSHGLYTRSGTTVADRCNIVASNGWGVLDYSRDLRLSNSTVKSRHGVYLRCDYAKLKNNVVQGSTYGVYGHFPSGKHEILQSTIGNVTHYGIYRNSGNMVVRNTIVDANIYAFYSSNQAGELEHDHNLVHAARANFVGVNPGLDEIEKDPIFLDPAAGDLHLAAGSPAINAGADMSSELLEDIEGNARPSFKQFEIGAYEFTDNEGSIRVLHWDEKAQ